MSRPSNRAANNSHRRGGRRCACRAALALLLLSTPRCALLAQAPPAPSTAPSSPTDAQRIDDMERRLNDATAALDHARLALEKSLREIQGLRSELNSLKGTSASTTQPTTSATAADEGKPSEMSTSDAGQPDTRAAKELQDQVNSLRDEQDAMQAEIKQHDQTKVETASKYPLRVSGLLLFNAFSNAGVVDDAELPTVALPRNPGSSHGSDGATVRQTLLTVQATGPTLAGALSSAELSVDFFGGVATNLYGYSSSAGSVQMRPSVASLDWKNTTAQAGYTGPLISPLSPTSYATVAQAPLSASGNLWTWSPQLRIEQRIPLSDQRRFALEAGLIFPPSPGYTSIQLVSPVEASRRPGYEGRASYQADGGSARPERVFAVGLAAYSANQFYSSSTRIHSWAVAGDLRISLLKWFEVSGEAYRGAALGGLGGGAYKDILSGTDAATGLSRNKGVDAIGGWTQLKLRFSPLLETNAAFGLDDAFASNFDNLVLSASTNPWQMYARNGSGFANVIFRPKTYLIFSPEYRRVQSWSYTGPRSTANIFTLSAGYQF